jgi:hypothetical protein
MSPRSFTCVNVSNYEWGLYLASESCGRFFHRSPSMPQQHSNTTMNINKMTITLLKQELTQRGLPTDGLNPALVERLQLTMPWIR